MLAGLSFGNAQLKLRLRVQPESAVVPKKCARRRAVSPVIVRVVLSISLMRLVGTPRWRASFRGAHLSLVPFVCEVLPGWMVVGSMISVLVIVHAVCYVKGGDSGIKPRLHKGAEPG